MSALNSDALAAMASLPFVRRDRFCEATDHLAIYGWIEREDRHEDFVVLLVYPHGTGYITSSAQRTDEIGRLLGGSGPDRPCVKVEDHLPESATEIRTVRP